MPLAARQYSGMRSGGSGKWKDVDQELLDWLRDAEMSIPETRWRGEALEDYKFYAGDQDTDEVKSILAEQKRPATVYNEVMPKVNMLCGLAAQTKWDVNAVPVTKEDDALAELINGVIKHFRKRLKVNRKELECFEHTVKSGRSLLFFFVDGSNPFKPLIKCKRIPGFQFYIDPASIEYDMSDAKYAMIERWLTEKELERYWPGLNVHELQGVFHGTDKPRFFNEQLNKYRVIECWYRKHVRVRWLENPFTGKQEALTPSEYRQLMEAVKSQLGTDEPIPYFPGWEERIFYSIFSYDKEVEGGESPYRLKKFPFCLCGAYRSDDENRWFGVTNQMKDPQRSVNTMRRQLMHLLQTLPKGLLAHEAGTILNIEEYEERSAEPNFHLEVQRGMIDRFKFVQQPSISPIYGQFDAMASQSMKDASGIQNELMGVQTSSREPGVSVRARQETGLAVLYTLFDNYREFRKNGAAVLLSLIQQYITEEEVIRVEGEKGRQLIEINSQLNPQIEGYNDITIGEYDLVLDDNVYTATMRTAIAQIMADYNRNAPGSIPPDLIMEYSDVPFTVKERVRQSWEQSQQMAIQQTQQEQAIEQFKLSLDEREVIVKEKELQLKAAEAGAEVRLEEEKLQLEQSRQRKEMKNDTNTGSNNGNGRTGGRGQKSGGGSK